MLKFYLIKDCKIKTAAINGEDTFRQTVADLAMGEITDAMR